MASIILTSIQLGIAIVSFIGASKVMEWYHKDDKEGGK